MSKILKSKDGYEAFLLSLKVNNTYRGVIIGSAETASNIALDNLEKYFSRNIGSNDNLWETQLKKLPPDAKAILEAFSSNRKNKPLYIIKPKEFPLPSYYWIAELESRKAVHSDDPDYNSYLYLCWFSNKTNISIDSHIREAFKKLNWKSSADDYDITIF